MSYTTVEQLRPHLTDDRPVYDRIVDQQVILSDTNWHRFFNGSLQPDSFRAKSLTVNQLTKASYPTAGLQVFLADSPLVRESLLVADNRSLNRLYRSGIDYTIDVSTSLLTIVADSELAQQDLFFASFLPWTVWLPDEDFLLDPDRGQLRRLSAGSIVSGVSLYIDYQPLAPALTDALLSSAVARANQLVAAEIDPDQSHLSHPVLSAAATARALAIACRTAAARELSGQRGDSRIAASWRDLAEQHDREAERWLRNFVPPALPPRHPITS